MSNKIQLSNSIELSKGNKDSQKRRMLYYAKKFKGNSRNRERREK